MMLSHHRGTIIGAVGIVSLFLVVAFLAYPVSDTRRQQLTSPTQTRSVEVANSANTAPDQLINGGEIYVDRGQLAVAGFQLANQYTGQVQDTDSLQQLRAAIQQRGPGALAALQAELSQLEKSSNAPTKSVAYLHGQIGALLMYEGRLAEAMTATEKALSIGKSSGMPVVDQASLKAVLGIVALRQGEVDNCIGCVGPSSCILPISLDAKHVKPAGSRRAIEYFTDYLNMAPGDLRVRWLLNLAYMTLGEYPDQVPAKYRVPQGTFDSSEDIGRFTNIAPSVGLLTRGPNQAGGSIFDDFTGDGLPDLFVTSLDADRGAAFYVNRGDGMFEDHSHDAGLDDQIYVLNAVHADFDNDGHLDVLLLRGGWERAMRMSLLRNRGNSTFEDVTIESGLSQPISSETAAWGDYDNDGLIDLFVGGEYRGDGGAHYEQRNRCRLYHNEGNGKFVNVADKLGVAEGECTKGTAWGDYDADGRLDLFISNMNAPCRLYHQEANGTFRDVAVELGVAGPSHEFASHAFACWFWDFDNDGRLDLFVNDYSGTLAEFVALAMKHPLERHSRPRLYRNLGQSGFRDVTIEVGLDRDLMPMGCNFADVNNDGFLDLYFGTGRMALEALVPNLMFKNGAGQRFFDITTSSGTGHLQKGHGVSFADWNNDGNLDFYVVAGGGVPGDRSYNLLFQNPGQGNHWLKVKLVGTKTNRAAIGAQIKVDLRDREGQIRSVYRTIGDNSSFGGNAFVESIGLQDSTTVAEIQIRWPTSQSTQSFVDIAADQMIEITEGSDAYKQIPLKPVTTFTE